MSEKGFHHRLIGPLIEGDQIALVAPAGPLKSPEELNLAMTLVKELGLVPQVGNYVKNKNHYLAGQDADRLFDLQAALDDSKIRGVMALRGGYGCARLLPKTDWSKFRESPKPVFGFSDITSLHGALQAMGYPSFHSPMPSSAGLIERDEVVLGRLKSLMFSNEIPTGLRSERNLTSVSSPVEGILIGGNLAVFQTLIGTKWLPDPRGKILFLEDVNEPAYRLDRSLTHLMNCGYLDQLNGMVLGTFTEAELTGIEEMFERSLGGQKFPVLMGISAGHIRRNLAIPLGVNTRLNPEKLELEFLSTPWS